MTLYLCHESCEENGATIEVGGGWAGKIRFQSSEGALFATKAKEAFNILIFNYLKILETK